VPQIDSFDGLVVKLFFNDALNADWQRAQLGQHPTGRYHSS
jgi:hypothetical protein